MRALSFTQPHGWTIIHGGRRIENIPREITYRGDFLVYASKSKYDSKAQMLVHRQLKLAGVAEPHWSEVPRGAIIGKARFAECVDTGTTGAIGSFEAFCRSEKLDANVQAGWIAGPWCGFVTDVVPCKPFEFKRGSGIGFFDVSGDVVSQLVFDHVRIA